MSAPTTEPMSIAQASLYQRLRTHLAELKLATAAEHLPAVLEEATEARRLAGRLRFVSLPSPATLEGFDLDAALGLDPGLVNELASCRYLETATNVLLIGPPGVGKTHLAVGLARKAAEAGYRTYFTTAADLAPRADTRPRSRTAGPRPCASTPGPPC